VKDNKRIIDNVEYEYNPTLQCAYDDKTGTFEEIIDKWSKDSKIPIYSLKLNVAVNDEQKIERVDTKAKETYEADSV
jgi:hypothetical protein